MYPKVGVAIMAFILVLEVQSPTRYGRIVCWCSDGLVLTSTREDWFLTGMVDMNAPNP
jgi:hypothetical protein